MRALVFENSKPRLAATRILSALSPRAFVGPTSALQLREIAEPSLPAEDWVVATTRLCGLCGSDYKQVFMNGALDNPMTAMISWPQVLGHEVVGVIDELGPGRDHQVPRLVAKLDVGRHAVLRPRLERAKEQGRQQGREDWRHAGSDTHHVEPFHAQKVPQSAPVSGRG